MTWVRRNPDIIRSLEESLSSYASELNRSLCLGYIEHMKKRESEIPSKNGFDLSLFTQAIPSLCLHAIIKPDQSIIRVVGEATKIRMGRNVTGMNYYDFVPEERRPTAIKAMNMIVEIPCAMRIESIQVLSNGERRDAEFVALPLRSEEQGVDGFVVTSAEQLGEQPTRIKYGVELKEIDIVKRDLIDLGFGVDETFYDLVRT